MIKLYIIKKSFYWHTQEKWTICFEMFLATSLTSERHYFPKIIQNSKAAKEFIDDFKRNNPNTPVGFTDKTKL